MKFSVCLAKSAEGEVGVVSVMSCDIYINKCGGEDKRSWEKGGLLGEAERSKCSRPMMSDSGGSRRHFTPG